jgi:hypothetical protein
VVFLNNVVYTKDVLVEERRNLSEMLEKQKLSNLIYNMKINPLLCLRENNQNLPNISFLLILRFIIQLIVKSWETNSQSLQIIVQPIYQVYIQSFVWKDTLVPLFSKRYLKMPRVENCLLASIKPEKQTLKKNWECVLKEIKLYDTRNTGFRCI